MEDAVQKRLGGGGEGASKPIEDMTLDELEEMEDEADEQILLEYRWEVDSKHSFKLGCTVTVIYIDVVQSCGWMMQLNMALR